MNWRSLWQVLEDLSINRLVRYLLLLALGWALIQVLAYFQTVIIIFIFSAILAFLLNFPVRWLSRFSPHGIAVIIVFLLSLALLGGILTTLGAAILDQGQELIDQSPELISSVTPLIDRVNAALAGLNLQIDLNAIAEGLRGQIFSGLNFGLSIVQSILSNLVDLILVAVVAFFMLLEGKRLWHFILSGFPDNFQEELKTAIQSNFLGFFWGRLLLSIFFAVSCFIVFIILKIPYALLLAAIGGLFDLIPGIGATIGVVLIALISLPQGPWTSVQIIIICVLLQQVEENLLMPRIMQGSINMNPVVLFFALLVGAKIAGLVGIFLSVPVAGVIISLFDLDALQSGKSK